MVRIKGGYIMININKAKAMPKGWRVAISVDAKNDLAILGASDGYARNPLGRKLLEHGISDTMLVTKEDLLTLLQAIA